MKQKDIFLAGEGDAWHARNRTNIGLRDPVSDAIEGLALEPKRVLEVGCGTGWRLKRLAHRYRCTVAGIDPSPMALEDTWSMDTTTGTADSLPFPDGAFDMVIFGFCLYLVDREDLFKVVAESDRVLHDGGYIIIHDFKAPMKTFARAYEHCSGVLSYHMDHPALWLAHPMYHKVAARHLENEEALTVLRKATLWQFRVMG
jgi:ubiquinone/menaquinone biosynthesis C-methylase UbiE